MHAVRLIAPSKMQSSILQLKLKSIDVRGKHNKACGPRECSLNIFPREVTVHFRSLPHFFEDKDIYDCIKFPNVKKLSPTMKEKFSTEDQGFVYTGFAYGKVMVSFENEEEALKNWTEQSCTKTFHLYEMDSYCTIPSLLTCSYCQTPGKTAEGHHEAYCTRKRTEKKQRGTNRKQVKGVTEKTPRTNENCTHQETNDDTEEDPPLPSAGNKNTRNHNRGNMEEPRSLEPTQFEETIQSTDEETMSQFISRKRNETEHHKLNQTELEPEDEQSESKLESIGTIRGSNRNSSKKNESKIKKIPKPAYQLCLKLPKQTMTFKVETWSCNGLDKEIKLINFLEKTLKIQRKTNRQRRTMEQRCKGVSYLLPK